MKLPKSSSFGRYLLIFTLVIIAGLLLRFALGPVIERYNLAAVPCPECLPTPTAAAPGQVAQLDQQLIQSMSASFAYNAPESLGLNQTTTINLLLNPSTSPAELATQVINGGSLVSGSVEITPRMKASLIAVDENAFAITALHDNPVQVVSANETTKWEWLVTPRKEGLQHLTLVIYRLVKFQNQDYWREVKTYQSDIAVNVTLAQRIESLDWGWIGGLFVTALLVPAFWRWVDQRKKKRSTTSHAPHGHARR